jgi:hypothetical protein
MTMMYQQIVDMTKKTAETLICSAEDLLLRLVFGPPSPKRPSVPDTFEVQRAETKLSPVFQLAQSGEIPEPATDQKWQTKDRRRTSIPFFITYVTETHITTDAGYNIKIERLKKHYRYLGRLV